MKWHNIPHLTNATSLKFICKITKRTDSEWVTCVLVVEGVLTGDRSFPDLFSTSSQMTVMLFTDASSNDRGFLANFSTGVNLGQPGMFSALYYMSTITQRRLKKLLNLWSICRSVSQRAVSVRHRSVFVQFECVWRDRTLPWRLWWSWLWWVNNLNNNKTEKITSRRSCRSQDLLCFSAYNQRRRHWNSTTETSSPESRLHGVRSRLERSVLRLLLPLPGLQVNTSPPNTVPMLSYYTCKTWHVQ